MLFAYFREFSFLYTNHMISIRATTPTTIPIIAPIENFF